MKTALQIALAAIALSVIGVGDASVFKCRDAQGKLTYSDQPCASGQKSEAPPVGVRGVGSGATAGLDKPTQALCAGPGRAAGGREFADDTRGSLPIAQAKQMVTLESGWLERGAQDVVWRTGAGGLLHACFADATGARNEFAVSANGIVTEVRSDPRGKVETPLDASTLSPAQARCHGALDRCLSALASRGPLGVDACVADLPRCEGGAVSECCPADCLKRYGERRPALEPIVAVNALFTTEPACLVAFGR